MIAYLLSLVVAASPTELKTEYSPEVRHLIQRGIEAHGGAKQLERLSQNWRAKIKGTVGKMEITGEMVTAENHKSRVTTTLHSWIPVDVIVVDDGDHVWRRIAGMTNEVTGNDRADMRDGVYRHHVQELLPLLREPGFTVSRLPEIVIDSKAATGIRVQSSGHRDIDLYFDNGTGLLAKTESRILQPDKPPIVLEKIVTNYRDFDGLKLATKFTKFENKKQTSVEEYVTIEFVAHIGEHEFDKP